MEDQDVIDRINAMAHEEESLWGKAGHGDLSDDERNRLKEIELRLDQCWDLLHQRRARRSAGLDPAGAEVRDVTTVEGYVG